MLTRSVKKHLLSIQYEKGFLEYSDLPLIAKNDIIQTHKNKKLFLNRYNMLFYYLGRVQTGPHKGIMSSIPVPHKKL